MNINTAKKLILDCYCPIPGATTETILNLGWEQLRNLGDEASERASISRSEYRIKLLQAVIALEKHQHMESSAA